PSHGSRQPQTNVTSKIHELWTTDGPAARMSQQWPLTQSRQERRPAQKRKLEKSLVPQQSFKGAIVPRKPRRTPTPRTSKNVYASTSLFPRSRFLSFAPVVLMPSSTLNFTPKMAPSFFATPTSLACTPYCYPTADI